MAKKLNKKSDVKVFALGGLGEVGKNCYCIEYLNQIFIIDSGILFPDEHLLGVDYVIPDFTYLIENESKIVGLFITHGHEDHIGGIPYLLKLVNIPKIYAAGIAIDLIHMKLSEFPGITVPPIINFNGESTFEFDGTVVSFVRLNHSIPDSYAIAFKTKEGTILHTGDFKIDFTPVGPAAEYEKLTRLGNEGVLLLLADSTNAMTEGFSSSEKMVGESIKDLFSHIKDRIIVATFSSNIYRIQQVIEASLINKRKIAVFGRSMEKTIEVGIQTGYIKATKNNFISPNDINNYRKNEVTILCTGSQGEPMAALSRVANGSHKYIKLIPGDTVIFSSSPIPGNAEGVNKTINALFKCGADVIVNSPINGTHTSGHANQGELKMIHSFVRPKYFMPIHGEYRMLKTHAKIAAEVGCDINNTFIMSNGDVLKINRDEAYVEGKVKSGEVYIEGTRIGDFSSEIIRERKLLSNEGLFTIIFTIDMKNKTIPADVQVVSRGFIYMKDSGELTKRLTTEAKNFLLTELKNSKTININQLQKSVTEYMTKIIVEETDRKPMVVPVFMQVNE